MARAPLLQLSGIGLGFGGAPLFEGLDLVVQPGDRLALVGRNGSGKSTLMKLMAGRIAPDSGARILSPGTAVATMEQEPDLSGHATLGDFAAADLEAGQDYKVEIAAEGLGFDPAIAVGAASGGERRRAALARLLAGEPELMLLDEPTNHLDINAIGWLERHLAQTRAAFVLISHDRAFLRGLARATLWLDRGRLERLERGFDAFEEWRDKAWEEEDLARHKLERKIKAEARWAVEGISARRKRNQGRVRALQALRAERADMVRRQGGAAMALEAGPRSGKRVIVARGLSKSYGARPILRDLTLTIERGERVALVGPNGAGKTTLIGLLTGALAPDAGEVTLGAGLELALFDQNRAALDPEASLWETLTETPGAGVPGRADQVMVRGTPRHVVGYLGDFLFSEAQARGPVKALSGGEKARLLLARLMARQSNLLVLDEPTNDLDIESLDLLQEALSEYDGTVILVSHDRDFIDRVATTTLAAEGGGRWVAYAGGWSDMQSQRAAAGQGQEPGRPAAKAPAGHAGKAPPPARAGKAAPPAPAGKAAPSVPPSAAPAAPASAPAATGLTFTQKHRLAALPAEIDRLSAEIARLEALLADPQLYTADPARFAKASAALVARQTARAAAEDEWLDLAEKAEG